MVKASKPVVRLKIRTAFVDRNVGIETIGVVSDDKELNKMQY